MAAAKMNVVEHIDWQIEELTRYAKTIPSEAARAILQETVRTLKMAKVRIEHQEALRIATPTVRDAYRQAALQGLLAGEFITPQAHPKEALIEKVDWVTDAMMESR